MLTIFTRSVLLYIAALLSMRIMGKREVGQLQPFEVVVVIMIAELAATPMGGVGIPLLYGVLPMIALVVCHGLINTLMMRSQKVRDFFNGVPTVLMRKGALCEKQMRRTSMDMDELLQALRTAGYADPGEVDTVILEPGGQMSIIPKERYRPVTPADLNLHVGRGGVALPLVMDGEIQQSNLRRTGLSERWVNKRIAGAGFQQVADVLLLSLNPQGEMLIQGKGCTQAQILPVLDEEAVNF